MLAVLLAALVAALPFSLAAAPLDAPHAAVLTALRTSADASSCDANQMRAMAADAEIHPLGRISGDPVVLAGVHNSCICGAQNCPYYILRLTPAAPRVLLTQYGIDARIARTTAAPPDVTIAAHDSALVTYDTHYAFRGGRYVTVSTERVRQDTGARKPDSVEVRFAPGASSAPLHGSVSLGWFDAYTFAASAGQRVTVTDVRPKALTLSLFGPGDMPAATLKAGTPFTLPRNGTYSLHVDTDSETDVKYALTFAIR